MLEREGRNRLVYAIILTRIDYCNAMFPGLPDSTLAPLQRVLHACFVDDLRQRDHVTETSMSLHWLPERERITHKLRSLMRGVVYGHAPEYFTDMVVPVADLAGRRHLRSAQDCLFDIPRSRIRDFYLSLYDRKIPLTVSCILCSAYFRHI